MERTDISFEDRVRATLIYHDLDPNDGFLREAVRIFLTNETVPENGCLHTFIAGYRLGFNRGQHGRSGT